MAVLFGWTYFFGPKTPPADQSKPTDSTNASPANPAPVVANQAPAEQTLPAQAAPSTLDNAPNRVITIKGHLFEAKFDSKGAVATSWVILKDRSPQGERDIHADGSTADNLKPLQLISEEALKRSPRELPFRLVTVDQSLNTMLNDRNYQISVPEDTITIADGEEKKIDFTLVDASGVEVTKSFVFRGGDYVADLSVKLSKGGQPIDAKLAVGASIGDHSINNHNFYHIESETVSAVGGHIVRYQGGSFTYDSSNQGALSDAGDVDWAGVADAYFAMVAIPAKPTQGLEYKASKYDIKTQKPFYDGIFGWVLRREKQEETRHLITALVPIATDGGVTKVFTGTKDYFLLSDLNTKLTEQVGRQIDIEDVINFSNYRPIRYVTKPLSIPILYALNFLHKFTNNYGLSIIVFTFFFYSLLFPLRWSQTKSFKKASANAPKMKEIQDKIKALQKKGIPMESPEMRQLQMEQLKLTKAALPIGGCLPMLLQFPLLLAFYTAVTVSLAIRQAQFLWLPDLSAGDPYHLLEFAFAASMVLSMKFTPTSPTVTPEQQMQQKMMTYLMPLMMLWVMWQAPSGLLVYWFFGNVVSFGQQLVINRYNKTHEPSKEEVVASVPRNAKKIN